MNSNQALEWRRAQLARISGNARLKRALEMWQGCDAGMSVAIAATTASGVDPEFMMHAATLLHELCAGPELPVGTVLWHAAHPSATFDLSVPLPTAATRQGALHFASTKRMNEPVIHKLVVASAGVRALPVGEDPDYEGEVEILVMPGVTVEAVAPAEHLVHAPDDV